MPAGDVERDRRQRRVALAERGARLRVAADRRVVDLHDVGEAGRCTELLGALLERLEAIPAARVLFAAVLALGELRVEEVVGVQQDAVNRAQRGEPGRAELEAGGALAVDGGQDR